MITSSEIDGLWNIGDPKAGLNALSVALELHSECADEIHTQIARALGLIRRFDDAWTEISKVSAEHSVVVEVRLKLESGRLKNTSGDKEGAAPFFVQALEIASVQ